MVLEELQFLEQQIVPTGARDGESTQPAPGGQCSGSPRCPSRSGFGHSRSLPKWVPKPRRLLRKHLSFLGGACPGDERAREISTSHRFPQRQPQMRRILNQCANAAVRTKGSIFEIVYRRLVLRLGHNQTIGAIAHRLCRLIWIILHRGVRYEERGLAVCERLKRIRTGRMIRQLRSLGYPSNR